MRLGSSSFLAEMPDVRHDEITVALKRMNKGQIRRVPAGSALGSHRFRIVLLLPAFGAV